MPGLISLLLEVSLLSYIPPTDYVQVVYGACETEGGMERGRERREGKRGRVGERGRERREGKRGREREREMTLLTSSLSLSHRCSVLAVECISVVHLSKQGAPLSPLVEY